MNCCDAVMTAPVTDGNDVRTTSGQMTGAHRFPSCELGRPLPSAYYSDEKIYAADVQRVWREGWLFALHACELPSSGDYQVMKVDADSIVLIRSVDGIIRGFHNVCRHRGSLVCIEPMGRANRLVCPYHQWAYDLEGKLVGCRGMPSDFDKSVLGLKPVTVREVAGLVFVNLSRSPSSFENALAAMEPFVKPQGLNRARVAHVANYRVKANWKIVWENNRECYHCNSNHPEYIRANFDHYNSDDTTREIASEISEVSRRMEEKWAARGLAPTHCETGMTRFPDAARGIWYSANRTVLVDDWVSETLDGRQVAPLMGDYPDADVGTLRVRTLPNLWMHASCDHAVSTRLLPVDSRTTDIRVVWLVDAGAREGTDYVLDRILPFWQCTSEQDWTLCENQQQGVQSSAYEPGPYSPAKEYNVEGFIRWYMSHYKEVSRS